MRGYDPAQEENMIAVYNLTQKEKQAVQSETLEFILKVQSYSICFGKVVLSRRRRRRLCQMS
jgi:hypothetical protein